jgi:hypothetical protein
VQTLTFILIGVFGLALFLTFWEEIFIRKCCSKTIETETNNNLNFIKTMNIYHIITKRGSNNYYILAESYNIAAAKMDFFMNSEEFIKKYGKFDLEIVSITLLNGVIIK